MKRYLVPFAVSLVAVTGCSTVESVNAYIERRDQAKEDERLRKASVSCERFGFKPGSDAFARCMQTEVNNIKNREAIADAAAKAAPPVPTPSTTTTNCTKTFMGVTCTTN